MWCKTSSVTGNYYLVLTSDPVLVYQTQELTGEPVIIPPGKQFFVQPAKGKYREALYFGRTGYIAKRDFAISTPYKYSDLSLFGIGPDSSYHFGYKQSLAVRQQKDSVLPARQPTYTPSQTAGGTVNVKGFYRKNGTYVAPHTRSAPKRKG